MTALAITAKAVSNIGWFINYVQAVELFPTCARVSGMSFCATFAAVIGTSAPYVILLVRWIFLNYIARYQLLFYYIMYFRVLTTSV